MRDWEKSNKQYKSDFVATRSGNAAGGGKQESLRMPQIKGSDAMSKIKKK